MSKGKKQEKIYDENILLYEIYRMRGLTINQLCDVMFHSRNYAYKYLQRLKEDGWLTYKMGMNGKIRREKVYFCTDKAIDHLENQGYIEKRVNAADNTPVPSKLWYTILTNEVYAALTPYGIHMYDSREWKRKYGMDRNTLVRGGLKMPDGRELGLYLFFSSEQKSGAGLSDAQLARFLNEIKKFSQGNRFAVVCYDAEIYKKVVKAVEMDKTTTVYDELLIIPMGRDGYGFNLLRMSRSEQERKRDIEAILNARLYKEHLALKGNRQNFAHYVADYGDRETYVVDFLSMNHPVLHHLSTHYYDKIYEEDGRKVDLVCWKASEGDLKRKYAQYPHVNIVPISLSELTDTYISQMDITKLK